MTSANNAGRHQTSRSSGPDARDARILAAERGRSAVHNHYFSLSFSLPGSCKGFYCLRRAHDRQVFEATSMSIDLCRCGAETCRGTRRVSSSTAACDLVRKGYSRGYSRGYQGVFRVYSEVPCFGGKRRIREEGAAYAR